MKVHSREDSVKRHVERLRKKVVGLTDRLGKDVPLETKLGVASLLMAANMLEVLIHANRQCAQPDKTDIFEPRSNVRYERWDHRHHIRRPRVGQQHGGWKQSF